MPKMKLDLRGVKAGSEPIPDGRYPIEVVDADIKKGKESQQPYLWMHLRVTEGEEENRRVFFQGTLNADSQGLGITMGSINALMGEDVTGKQFELDTDELVGLEADAIVVIEDPTEEGQDPRNRVKNLKPLDPDSDRAVAKEEEGDRPW